MEEILCAVASEKKFKSIEKACGNAFIFIPSYSALDALKQSINGDFEVFIVDSSIDKSIPQPLTEMWSEIDETKNVPRVMSQDSAGGYIFSDNNFLTFFVYVFNSLALILGLISYSS